MTYAEKLRDPHWQKRRLEILQRDGFRCQFCSSTEFELHVHHKRYFKKLNPWEYSDEDLITLCDYCHEQITEFKNQLGSWLSDRDGYFILKSVEDFLQYGDVESTHVQKMAWIIRECGRNPMLVDLLHSRLLKWFEEIENEEQQVINS